MLELGQLVGAAPGGLLPEGFTTPQDQPHGALRHFMDVRSKPLGAQDLFVEEPAHLGGGERRNVAEARGGQRGLAFGLHHATIANEDEFGDPKRVRSVCTCAGTVTGSSATDLS